jgi:DNA replication protein DnaC
VSCPLCNDRGYLRTNVPVGHPQFGKLIECQCKQARKNEARRQRLRDQSKIEQLAAFQEETFASFHFWLPGVEQAYEAAKQFAQTPQGWLVLAGNNGCGKTHLAVAIAKCCLEDGMTVLFAVVPDLLDRLRSAFAPTAEETFDEEFAKMREVEVLILDDLGSEQSTGWATEKLFQLLNYRYNARLATVFTTNKVGLEGIAPRLRSRLSDRRLVCTVTLADAQDFREMELGQ